MEKSIHIIQLTDEEYHKLIMLVKSGIEHARTITRARVLLLAHAGKIDKKIAGICSLSTKTPYEIRKRYHIGGLEGALYDRPRPGQPRRFNGAEEAEIVAIACTNAPKGYAHWTLDLLTEEARGRGIRIGRTAVGRVLLRNNSSHGGKKCGA